MNDQTLNDFKESRMGMATLISISSTVAVYYALKRNNISLLNSNAIPAFIAFFPLNMISTSLICRKDAMSRLQNGNRYNLNKK